MCLLANKSGALDAYRTWAARAVAEHVVPIKVLRTDNGAEYLYKAFQDLLAAGGTKHELTVHYSPESNGVTERVNRTLGGITRSLLLQGRMADDMWPFALSTATHLLNRLPTSFSLSCNSPARASAPYLQHLTVFWVLEGSASRGIIG